MIVRFDDNSEIVDHYRLEFPFLIPNYFFLYLSLEFILKLTVLLLYNIRLKYIHDLIFIDSIHEKTNKLCKSVQQCCYCFRF